MLGLLAVSPELLPTVQSAQGNRLQLVSTILEPHLASVKARYDGLQPLYNLVNTFANTINKFFKDKRIDYSVRSGFRIVVETAQSSNQEITPAQLSSGEQQLLLLFCHFFPEKDFI